MKDLIPIKYKCTYTKRVIKSSQMDIPYASTTTDEQTD